MRQIFKPLRSLWKQIHSSSNSVSRLVLYIQIVTVVTTLSSVILIEAFTSLSSQSSKKQLNSILLEETQVTYLVGKLGEIDHIKEDFLLSIDNSEDSTREFILLLQEHLLSLSSEFKVGWMRRTDDALPPLITKEFDSAQMRILRAQRVVSTLLRNSTLTRDDALDVLRGYPLKDLRLAHNNLLASNNDLHLLSQDLEREIRRTELNYEILLIITVIIASCVAMLSSYLVYKRKIVKPLESIFSITSAVPILNTAGDTSEGLADLQVVEKELQSSDNGVLEIRMLRQMVSGLLNRLVLSCMALNDLSMTDPLCQIGNRRSLDIYGAKAWKQAVRTVSPIAILMIDVDHFKQFNDVYGHTTGDQVLVSIASCIAKALRRPLDDCFRYGGEEFLILMYDVSAENFDHFCNELRASVENLSIGNVGAETGRITISCGGCYVFNPCSLSLDDAIQRADQELYRSKKQGRNQVSIYSLERPWFVKPPNNSINI